MFCQLHIHDAKGSLLDSILKVEDIVNFAAENRQKSIALTNHGYMTSYVDFVKECNKNGIKPIIGNEVYEVDDMYEKSDSKTYRQPRYHLVLLSKNEVGYHNLIKITSASCTEGFYIKPRIDLSYIKNNNLGEGIICLTACQAGRLSRLLVDERKEDAHSYFERLCDTFDNVFCEIQSHDTQSQIYANQKIIDFAKTYNYPLVITTDAHMIDNSYLDAHSIFVKIGDGRDVDEVYQDCCLQTEDYVHSVMDKTYGKDIVNGGISNTEIIANMIDDIDIGLNKGNIMPKVDIDSSCNSHKEYLRNLVFRTFEEKFGHMSKKEQEIRKERLETELEVLYAVDYTDYFIMLYMLAKEARKRKIPIGYSRGSGANCLCLFMLGVTQIDSVRWGLDFSRFANLGRKSMADFDWDISKRRRKEMVQISEELFGKENVAPIATFNTLSTKVAIRDVGKVLDEDIKSPYYKKIPYSLRDEVSKMIPTIKTLNDLGEEEEKETLLKDILGKNEKLNEVYNKFPLWFKYVTIVEGLPKSLGRHAAGTLITPKPVVDYCPLCYDSEKNIMIQLEMHNAMDDLGLIKMDYLGLETLDIVDDTLKNANLTWNNVDINHLDLADSLVYENVYKKGNTIGIFQMESAEAKKMCIEANADNIEDIIVINAANRPGTKDSFPTYCANKLSPENAVLIHDDLRTIFSATQSVLLYQEQALQIFRYAGFPEEDVDNARRSIGKKDKNRMAKLEIDFRKGLQIKGWNDSQITEIWNLMLKQAEYSFNRGHATAYGLLSYLTAYLKTHYPLEFMCALLTSKSDKTEKMSVVINDCKRLGINVLPPNINHSNNSFTINKERNEILFGLLAVKGLGESIVNKIIANRPYENLIDFIEKVGDKTAIITLIKAGATPSKDKMKALRRYAAYSYECRAYKPITSLPTHKRLLDMGIDIEKYRNGTKLDKDKLLIEYNRLKEQDFNAQTEKKYQAYMSDFYNKYAQDEYLWEFQTLSMFITDDPLKKAYDYITTPWNKVQEGDKTVLCCVITDIKRKKDKNGNQFAYLDLYSPFGIIESTIWSSQLKEYSDLIKKGNCLAIKGRKREGDHFFVEKVKPYSIWLQEKGEH